MMMNNISTSVGLINLLLYGDPQFDYNKNTRLLNTASKYIIDSSRFTVPLI